MRHCMHCQCSTIHHVDCSKRAVKDKARRPGQALWCSKEEAGARRQAGPGAAVRLAWRVCKLLQSSQITSATIMDEVTSRDQQSNSNSISLTQPRTGVPPACQSCPRSACIASPPGLPARLKKAAI